MVYIGKEGDLNFDDPVIQAELQGRYQQPRDANYYYARPPHQDEATVNDDNFEMHDRDNIMQYNYGAIPQNQPVQQNVGYPQSIDASVADKVNQDDIDRKHRSRWLDFFTKLRGEDERQDFLQYLITILNTRHFIIDNCHRSWILIAYLWHQKQINEFSYIVCPLAWSSSVVRKYFQFFNFLLECWWRN